MRDMKERAVERLNLAQLEAAKREGYKDGFHAGQRAACERAYLDGHRQGMASGKAFMRAIRHR
jgi:flagellar biosynthesis/type III secretory pathway protein FliH